MTKTELFLRGFVRAEIESASPEAVLNRLSREKIPFWDTEFVDAYHMRFSCFYRHRNRVEEASARAQGSFRVTDAHLGVWHFFALFRRVWLVAGVLLSIALTLYLQEYVWFLRVSGNETVSSDEITRALASFGVEFGAKCDEIDSQNIKNRLLGEINSLQWAAVNCSGGVCRVLVKERAETPALLDRKQPCDIVALRSGTITELSVLEGQALCAVGDTVEAGDVLVSGVNDFVVRVQNVHAQAEIYARTWHDMQLQIPREYQRRADLTQKSTSRYLQLGRFRIKLSGNSSNLSAGCDKISSRYTLSLPGGYCLPITLIEETCTVYDLVPAQLTKDEAEAVLLQFGETHLNGTMTAGKLLSVQHTTADLPPVYSVHAVYACEEMIAAEQEFSLFGSEEIYGRTNSERGTR